MNKETINLNCQDKPCPVETTLNIISGKWKGIILYRLLGGKIRFNEFKRMMPNITHRALTIQLRQLEQDGVVKRTVYPEVPPRVEYELTSLGFSMEPIIKAMYDWGSTYQKNSTP
ncbi:HxlR family transcriptional regulator [Clostridium sp. MF28]|uniref:winged helix-turn-helix transcriptional regulator n=1 Tax=Clostridium TaxID=1485 RepID=UPI000CF9E425|nr:MULTISPECIES: helix-turn-helix domain-containing protein [Clostridium]AVK49352.1 HxlR family transcriptional regulator [Clostridium sp. MF28]PSM58034.1 transcriptional regulator [Clostridium diolis]